MPARVLPWLRQVMEELRAWCLVPQLVVWDLVVVMVSREVAKSPAWKDLQKVAEDPAVDS